MNQVDEATFKQAVAMAQAGKKQEAYADLIKLSRATGAKDSNLLLWVAFTTSDMAEAEAAIRMAQANEPGNSNLVQANEWYKNEIKQREENKRTGSLPQPPQTVPYPAFVNLDQPLDEQFQKKAGKPSTPITDPNISSTQVHNPASASTGPALPYSQLPFSQPLPQPVYPLTPPANKFPAITRVQGYVLIGLLAFLVLFAFWNTFKPAPKWEYKTVTFLTAGNERKGTEAFNYSSIKLDQEELAALGSGSWELVSDYLEMETAFPNFGDTQYVTGLQPNIRPQSLVLIFKRLAR
jgi:hypothetical protein